MTPLSIVRDAWFFFRNHWLSIAVLCVPLQAIEAITRHTLTSDLELQSAFTYSMLISLIFSPIYSAALVLYLGSRTADSYPSNRQLFSRALQLWPVNALLTALVSVLVLCGLTLLIVPGVYLLVRLCFAEFLLVLHGRNPFEALRESADMTQGYFWLLLQCMLIVMLPLWLAGELIFSLIPSLNPQELSSLPIHLVLSFAQLFTSVVLFRAFMLLQKNNSKLDS